MQLTEKEVLFLRKLVQSHNRKNTHLTEEEYQALDKLEEKLSNDMTWIQDKVF